ncbi:MAG TPA: DMT family transporter, partial [Lacisediminihabitans sp.]|uniref:DMT family transporter n=1 Tax=Lacisediminihabitans sp. TaxID=2787631 RepID=UPI002EDAFBD7
MPALSEISNQISLTPLAAIGIPIALVGSVFLAVGAQLQHRGVAQMDRYSAPSASGALSLGQILLLLRRPSWLFGTLMLGLAVVFQLTSLSLAPILVVQPLGAVALIITWLVNARVTGVKLTRATTRPIIFCVVGVGLFVTIATFTAKSKEITQTELVIILSLLAAITVIFAL